MSLRQTIAEVNAIREAINNQKGYIAGFRKSNNDNISIVRSELAESQRGFDQQMLTALDRAATAMEKAEVQLNQAAEALQRVSTI